jgi:hypothetical protein
MELAIVDEQHHRRRCELLGAGRQAEISLRVNPAQRTQIRNAVSAFEYRDPIPDDEYGSPRFARRLDPGENVIDLFCGNRVFSYAVRQRDCRQHPGCEKSDLCVLCESFAYFAVKIFYRKVR